MPQKCCVCDSGAQFDLSSKQNSSNQKYKENFSNQLTCHQIKVRNRIHNISKKSLYNLCSAALSVGCLWLEEN